MKHILLIEEDAPLCWLLGKILRTRYEVIIIKSRMEAWAWMSEGNIPDLIVHDIESGSSESIELLENIRINGLYNDIPVVILSGVKRLDFRQHCLDLGSFSYITKPFEPQFFLSEIQRGLLHSDEVVFID